MNIKPLGPNQPQVTLTSELEVFFSYHTPVACKWTNGNTYTYYQTEKKWSRTTTRHINKWLNSEGAQEAQFKPQEYFDNLLSNTAYKESNNA